MAVKRENNKSTGRKNNSDAHWVRKAIVMTFFLALIINSVSDTLLRNVNVVIAGLILITIISVGIVFDTLGTAVVAADEKPFHAMASKRIYSALWAIKLVKNASKVSNVCSDVIGDIVGVISGSAVALILVNAGVSEQGGFKTAAISVVVVSMVAAFSVGGKAYGRQLAVKKWKDIVHFAAKVLYFMDHRLHIRIMK